jgi:hypothetical protein
MILWVKKWFITKAFQTRFRFRLQINCRWFQQHPIHDLNFICQISTSTRFCIIISIYFQSNNPSPHSLSFYLSLSLSLPIYLMMMATNRVPSIQSHSQWKKLYRERRRRRRFRLKSKIWIRDVGKKATILKRAVLPIELLTQWNESVQWVTLLALSLIHTLCVWEIERLRERERGERGR